MFDELLRLSKFSSERAWHLTTKVSFLEGELRYAKKEVQHLEKDIHQSKSYREEKALHLVCQLLMAEDEIT